MSKRTLFLIFALFIITFVLLLMALQPSAPKAAQTTTTIKEPTEQTVLLLGNPLIATSSSTSTLNYSLPINISTGKNKVTAVQLELQYDPNVLTSIEATPGSFFSKPEVLLNQTDTVEGRISYAFGVGATGKGITGSGTVANLTFSVKSKLPQKTAIIFLPKTLVTAEGISGSALNRTNVGQFTVGIVNSTSSAATK